MTDPTPQEQAAATPHRESWVIDVCRTCGRHAQWPFCEHRPESGTRPDGKSWCSPVRVTGLWAPS